MSIPTVAVTCTAYDQNGNAVAGGTFRARLNSTEIYNGFVVPEQVTGVADASGVCVLQLWPNALGVAGSAYRITAINPDTGQKYLDTTAVVPNSACNLHQIIVAAPYPTVDASQQALVAAQGALAAVTAQAGIATTKAAEASASATTAATQAGIATTQAGTATTQAGIATIQATTATTQADIAAIQAGIATTKASEASASAATATTQAGTATTKASEAAASAATATTQAGTATTQAGVATTKASEAAASATNASNSAYTAGLSVDAAVTAKNQAVSSASAAASSATAASGSATAASTSASSASASASTATTQAGTATTQAGLATTAATTATSKASEASTYASNASASANTSTTQAGVATTQAGIATTQAGVATTQAGIAIANANAALSVYGSVTAQQASVTAAQNAATSATASAAAANTSAGNASGSAASALAIYGTAAAQQTALTNAQSAASLAQGFALSASSAIQQDLSGVTAQALHRSPNAVTAMFVYDTSKDSDGGAWTEKCQHTSWYNEALNGKWLGAHASEFQARNAGATVSATELVTNGDFSNGTTGWTQYTGTLSDSGGVASFVPNSTGESTFYRTVSVVIGKTYLLTVDVLSVGAGVTLCGAQVGTSYAGAARSNNGITGTTPVAGQKSLVFVATASTLFVQFVTAGSVSASALDNISVREVTALNAASGDYYQSTVDGKFYKLNPTSGVTETFRGNKADFPRLAGIVAESALTNGGAITIYDLTEPGRPMWMRFTNGFENMLGSTSGFGACVVAAMNARLAIGNYVYDLKCVDFILDKAGRVGSAGINNNYRGSVAERNSNKSWHALPSYFALSNIVSRSINAVAMTVLPDAPVDAVTGLQVPTIAVATAGGTSVIKHNGTVVNSSFTDAHQAVDIKGTTLFVNDSSRHPYFATNIGGLGSAFPLTTYGNYGQGGGWQITLGKLIAAARNQEYGYFGREVYGGKTNEAASIRSLGFRIASTFNTGHLIGDIRRAYLADVDVGSVSGPELVVNGNNEVGIVNGTGPSVQNGTLTQSNERAYQGTYSAKYTCTSTSVGDHLPTVHLVPAGLAVQIDVWVYNPTGNFGKLKLIDTGNGSWEAGYTTVKDSWVNLKGTRQASSSAWNLGVGNQGAVAGLGFVFFIDNISVKEVVADRSYKAQGASITGTLTKTQVAAASQLVAYSGFSAANYLRENWSADLDFGTGEWSASAWVNVPVTLPDASFPGVGSDLVVNGDFSAGTTGWAIESGVTVDAGAMSFATNSNQVGYQTISATAGRFFQVTLTVVSYTSGAPQVSINAGASVNIPSPSVLGLKTFLVLAGSGDAILRIRGGLFGTGGTCSIDNITVKEIASALITDRAHSSGSRVQLGVAYDGKLTATAFDGTTTRTVTTTAAYNTATWIKPEAVYTTDGTLAIRVNGAEVAATRGTPLLTLNNSNAVLTIGNSFAADAPFPGSIALLKLSATVPTAEQSQWMYEQEKQMFRDGAQVCLPDSGSIVDLTYDDATDKWIAVSTTNESEWSGLVRTSVTPSPAGSYTKVFAASGVQLQARSTTNPGVDINIPSYGLREELVNRSQAAARLARNMVAFDYVGGFTANTTTGSTAIASVASLTYPVSYVGARISGAGIPANTTVVGVSGTTIYISAAATATASGVQISFVDFNLPVGYEAREVLTAGLAKVEGSTKDFTRLFDGFKETIRFGTAPGFNAAVQIQATRSAT